MPKDNQPNPWALWECLLKSFPVPEPPGPKPFTWRTDQRTEKSTFVYVCDVPSREITEKPWKNWKNEKMRRKDLRLSWPSFLCKRIEPPPKSRPRAKTHDGRKGLIRDPVVKKSSSRSNQPGLRNQTHLHGMSGRHHVVADVPNGVV